MRSNLRWQWIIVLLGLGLAALLAWQFWPRSETPASETPVAGDETAVSLPAAASDPAADAACAGDPVDGGVLVEGMVGAPRYLNPLLSDPNPVDRELVSLIFDGLTRYDDEGRLVPALAERWSVSEDGRTVRFSLRPEQTWHDGEPVTAEDVAFTYGLMGEDAFPGPPALAELWRTVTITVIDPLTVEFELAEPYSPFLEATTRGILPAHRLEGVTAATLADHPFNQSPVGTGPLRVAPEQRPRQTYRLRLLPADAAYLDAVEIRFFPDEATLLDAFAAGEVAAVNGVTPDALPRAAAMSSMRLFTASQPRYTALLFNLSPTGSRATRILAGRQGLAYGLDRAALLDRVLQGQGLPLEGPYVPRSWAYEATLLAPYPYQPETAVSLLESDGWTLGEGGTVRQRGEDLLRLRLLVLDDPVHRALAAAIASQWSELGVETELITPPDSAAWQTALAERDFDAALVTIRPGLDPDLYDFWSQEAIIRGQNYAGWNDRRASEALEQARQTWGVAERRPFYRTFLRLYDEDLPALTLFQHVYTYGVSERVGGVEIGRIDSPRERFAALNRWFLHTSDGPCPPSAASG